MLSSTHLIDEEYKYYVLICGQSLAAIAQPFFLFVPAKIAAVWFKENQRTTANMITSMCKQNISIDSNTCLLSDLSLYLYKKCFTYMLFLYS